LPATSQGSARPGPDPSLIHRAQRVPVLDGLFSRRRPLRRPPLRRQLPPDAWSHLSCWWSADRWLAHVGLVYRRHYLLLRPQLVALTGGGLSLESLLAVAGAHAAAADYRTGRSSRPLRGMSGGGAGLTAATGLGARTVARARTFLRLTGLATEVAPGRHRTRLERLESWRRGDRSRGWTAEYALHPSTTYSVLVDEHERSDRSTLDAGQKVCGTPPLRGSLARQRSGGTSLSTTSAKRSGGGRTGQVGVGRRTNPDPRGVDLADAWRRHPRAPCWATFSSAATWACLLSLPAREGWTAADLVQLLDHHVTRGHVLLQHPRQPIAYLSWLLHRVALDTRPTSRVLTAKAVAAEQRRRRTDAQLAERAEAAEQAATARVALRGPGRAAVQVVLDEIAGRRRDRSDGHCRAATSKDAKSVATQVKTGPLGATYRASERANLAAWGR